MRRERFLQRVGLIALAAGILAACQAAAPTPQEDGRLTPAAPQATEAAGGLGAEEPAATEEAEEAAESGPAEEPAAEATTRLPAPTPTAAPTTEAISVSVQRLPGAPTDPRFALVVDAGGRSSIFRAGEVIFDTAQASRDLDAFLRRTRGQVIDDGALPAPASLVERSTARRVPDFGYVLIRVDTGTANLTAAASNFSRLGARGPITFSSQEGQALMSIVAQARVDGLPVMPNFAFDAAGQIPRTGTDEGPAADGGTVDAFTLAYNELTHLTRAWQLIDALQIDRQARVAVIDTGFAPGMPGYENPDFPPPSEIPQWDVADRDEDASGAGESLGWHGTQVAGIAAAYLDNGFGTAGTGGQVSELVLLRVEDEGGRMSWYQVAKAIHQAVGLGAEVINLSMAGACDSLCETLGGLSGLSALRASLELAHEQGVIVIGAAGNGGTDQVGDNLASVTVMPCADPSVLCIGALDGSVQDGEYIVEAERAPYSNYGQVIDLWAPGTVRCTVLPDQEDAPPCIGTSAAAPFVTGVAAMMKAANPSLTHDDAARIFAETAQQSANDPTLRVLDAYAALMAAGGRLPDDAYEPNDDDRRAASIQLARNPTRLDGLTLSGPEPADHFTFTLTAPATLTITVEYIRSFGDVLISLHAENRANTLFPDVVEAAASGLSYDQQVIVADLSAGRYFITILPARSEEPAVYNLEIRR